MYNKITFFCLGHKNRSSGGIYLIFPPPDPANFSAYDRPGSEFPTVQNCPEKIKNPKLCCS